MKCRFCGNALTNKFVDLVNSPPSNSFLTQDQLNEPDNNGAYTQVTAVSVTEFMQNDILPRSLQQPQKAFEDFWGYPLFRSNR